MITLLLIKTFYMLLGSSLLGLYFLISSVGNFFPSIHTALNSLSQIISPFNQFLPLDTLISIIALILEIEFVIMSFWGVSWIYNKIRGAG